MDIKIDASLKSLVWPLSDHAYRAFRQQILRGNRQEPLYIWRGVLLKDFHQYEICRDCHRSFSAQEVFLKSREDAVIWVCKDQLRREDISEEMRKYLIGRQYLAQKALVARTSVRRNQFSLPRPENTGEKSGPRQHHRSADPLAEEYHLCYGSIQKYGAFAAAIDRLSEVLPDVRHRLLSGEVWISHDNLVAIASLEVSKIKLLGDFLRKASQCHLQESDLKRIVGYDYSAKAKARSSALSASVKHMPVYDPDTQALSLALTIPTWCSSMQHAQSTANFKGVSDFAKKRLLESLLALQAEIDLMVQAMKEMTTL